MTAGQARETIIEQIATPGPDDVQVIDADWVADQARCVLEDMPVSVFKIGLLGSVEIIAATPGPVSQSRVPSRSVAK